MQIRPAHRIDLRTAWWITGLMVAFLFTGSLLHYSRGSYSYTAAEGDPHVTGADDAYIAYRYGWNLVHYHNLSWNESGFRKTEGFTNPLWVYLSAAWSLVGNKDSVYPGVVISSVLLTALLLWGIVSSVLARTGTRLAATGIILLSASPIIWLHATSGLEATVFGASLGLLAYRTITHDVDSPRERWLTNGLASLIVLLRSDGFVYLLVLLIALSVRGPRHWKSVAIGLLVGLVILLGWRELNFQGLLPNTEAAKLNFPLTARIVPGLVLFTQSMINGGIVFVILGLFGALLLPKTSRWAAILTMGGWAAYYVFIGGDLFLERHLISLFALSAALSGLFFARVLENRIAWILVGVLLIGVYTPLLIRDPRFLYFSPRPQDSWILIGKEMAQDRATYGTVVTFPAGKIPFFAGGDFVDELGLNDPELALVKRPRFVPGHSAGNHALAVRIARQSSATYSYYGMSIDMTTDNSQDVLLWSSNSEPTGGVHHGLTESDRSLIAASGPFSYTIIFRGK